MKKEDAEEYTQALSQVVAGGWRQIALGQRMGAPKALGLSVEQWVKERLGGYIRHLVKNRRQAVAELRAEAFSNRQIAKILGVTEMTVRREAEPAPATNVAPALPKVKKIRLSANATATNVAPIDTVTALRADDELRKTAVKQTKKDDAKAKSRARRKASQAALPKESFDLRIGDAREQLADIQDDSVHLMLTDPPYGDEAEPLYRWLAEWSRRVLVPGGSLICFTGQSRCGRDITLLSEHLRYWWLLNLPHHPVQRMQTHAN